MSIHVVSCLYKGRPEFHLRYPGLTDEQAQLLANKINAGVYLNRRTLQADAESLDVSCKDYDLLERKHKQGAVHPDQQDHFEAGWEAAVRYYFG